jgi:hypothetical protein
MLDPRNLYTGDGRTFQGAEEHTPKGIPQGMAVTGFKGFRNEFGVSFGGAVLFLLQAVRQFESS